jgi:hypothetical protein
MKSALFCITCLAILNIVNAFADQQMKHDTQKMIHQSSTM